MKCPHCTRENPDEARYCLRCGTSLHQASSKNADEPLETAEFVTVQTQKTVSKMLETPGTMALGIGITLLLIAIIVGIIGHVGWAVGFGIVGVVILIAAIFFRRHEVDAAAAQAQYAPVVRESTEIKEREIVKVKCRYCGALNPDGANNCGSCGATL